MNIVETEDGVEMQADNFGENDTFDGFDVENSFYDDSQTGFDDADNFLGGKRKKRKKQRAELQRQMIEADNKINQQSKNTGVSVDAIALNNVEKFKPVISDFVEKNGMVPEQNPAALSLQATKVFMDKVEQKQQAGIPEYDSAHDSALEDVSDEMEEADEFFGDILKSVFQGGKALLNNVNNKRSKKGKKPLFAGKNWQKLAEKVNNNQPVIQDALNANEIAFLALTKDELNKARAKEGESALSAGVNAFAKDQKQQAFMAYLPYILIAAVVIFFIGKKTN